MKKLSLSILFLMVTSSIYSMNWRQRLITVPAETEEAYTRRVLAYSEDDDSIEKRLKMERDALALERKMEQQSCEELSNFLKMREDALKNWTNILLNTKDPKSASIKAIKDKAKKIRNSGLCDYDCKINQGRLEQFLKFKTYKDKKSKN